MKGAVVVVVVAVVVVLELVEICLCRSSQALRHSFPQRLRLFLQRLDIFVLYGVTMMVDVVDVVDVVDLDLK